MFCNGPEMDGGDSACLGPTTIIEITIPRCQSSSAMTLDDAGGLAGLISCPPIHEVVYTSDGRRNMRRFFFFFFFWRLGLCSALMSSGGVAHVVATCLTSTG